jgi:hypothetical protein
MLGLNLDQMALFAKVGRCLLGQLRIVPGNLGGERSSGRID